MIPLSPILPRRASSLTSDNPELKEKKKALESCLQEMGSVLVAYSGGTDSTFLSATASVLLGDRVLAVTAKSPSLAPADLGAAVEIAKSLGLNHRVIETHEVERADYLANDPNRCFFCKEELYSHLEPIAAEGGYRCIVNGHNADDLGDFRPGMSSAKRRGVRSPLVEAALTKPEIRALSREMGLPTWDKPAQACLSSRIPYGTPVTFEALTRVGRAEEFIRGLGIRQVRVRHHGDVARIEVELADIPLLADNDTRDAVAKHFRSIGYAYVTLDLDGFRSGSLNEALPGRKARNGPAHRDAAFTDLT